MIINCKTGGCELLNRWDTNHDGMIDESEMSAATAGTYMTRLTAEELSFIRAAYNLGENGINKLCKGCSPYGIEPTHSKSPSILPLLIIAAVIYVIFMR